MNFINSVALFLNTHPYSVRSRYVLPNWFLNTPAFQNTCYLVYPLVLFHLGSEFTLLVFITTLISNYKQIWTFFITDEQVLVEAEEVFQVCVISK